METTRIQTARFLVTQVRLEARRQPIQRQFPGMVGAVPTKVLRFRHRV